MGVCCKTRGNTCEWETSVLAHVDPFLTQWHPSNTQVLHCESLRPLLGVLLACSLGQSFVQITHLHTV